LLPINIKVVWKLSFGDDRVASERFFTDDDIYVGKRSFGDNDV